MALAAADSLAFVFDYISPYAYLAWTQIHAIAARAGVTVEPRPVVFAAMLAAHGTRGPAEVPAKRRYAIHDIARIAHRFGVALELPPAHPFNPLRALRVTSLAMPAAQRRALIDAIYAAAWRDARDITDAATLRAIVAAAGLPASALDDAAAPDVKARLRANTDAAIAAGAFGVPTMIVRGQMFWGCDSLPALEHFLAHGDVVSPELVARWERLPASATRPGADAPR